LTHDKDTGVPGVEEKTVGGNFEKKGKASLVVRLFQYMEVLVVPKVWQGGNVAATTGKHSLLPILPYLS